MKNPELEQAIIKAVEIHRRTPPIIQRAIQSEYPIAIELEEINSTLKELESQGKLRRYSHPSGRVTDMWEKCD
jgi:hypothetical protein